MNARIGKTGLKRRVPQLCTHKASGLCYVLIDGRRMYLGRSGDPQVHQKYHRIITEHISGTSRACGDRDELTIMELMDRYVAYAAGYYAGPDGRPNHEYSNILLALEPVKEVYSLARIGEFGPLSLKTVRELMIKRGWCRRHINHNIGRVKRMFRWATENELVPGSVYHALQAVPGLKRGRSEARESQQVRPVPMNQVEAVRPHVSRQVWTMIQMQLLTAARPGEVCVIRPCDIDRSGRIWIYSPADHKTSYCGHERKIYLGPRAQAVLMPFLLRSPQEYCFSPREADNERRALLRTNRKTPDSCGNRPGTNRCLEPSKQPGERYTTQSYGRAIVYGINKAFQPPAELARQAGETRAGWRDRLKSCGRWDQLKQWRRQHHWHAHQLRHNAATELRKEFGLETARVILGHRSAQVTEVYAELDHQKAIDVIAKIG